MSVLQKDLLPPGDAQVLAVAMRQCGKSTERPQLPSQYKWEEIARNTLLELESKCD